MGLEENVDTALFSKRCVFVPPSHADTSRCPFACRSTSQAQQPRSGESEAGVSRLPLVGRALPCSSPMPAHRPAEWG